MEDRLTSDEKWVLLTLARNSIVSFVNERKLLPVNVSDYSPRLQDDGASFVTLTMGGNLRGCIGALEPHQPLVQDVCEHAVAAAIEDYRFPPVQSNELPIIKIEISRLTIPQALIYSGPDDLVRKLRPHVDGVILKDGARRATFLPQVWEKLPDTQDFLSHLCDKMWAPSNLWKRKALEVFIYQVEEFSED